MTSFYNSEAIEVISEHLSIPSTPRKQRISPLQSPSSIKFASSKPESTHSKTIRHWLHSLGRDKQVQVVSIHDALLTATLLEMHRLKGPSGNVCLSISPRTSIDGSGDQILMKNYEKIEDYEQEFLELLRLTDSDEYLDTLTVLPGQFYDFDKLLGCMNRISHGNLFRAPCRIVKGGVSKKTVWELPGWLNDSNLMSLARLACAGLEQGIWMQYWSRNANRAADRVGYLPIKREILLSWDNTTIKSILNDSETIRDEYRLNGSKTGRFLRDSHGDFDDYSFTLALDELSEDGFIDLLTYCSFNRAYSSFDILAKRILQKILSSIQNKAFDSLMHDLDTSPAPKAAGKPKKRQGKVKKRVSPSTTNSSRYVPEAEEEVREIILEIVENALKTAITPALPESPTQKSEEFQLVTTAKRNKNPPKTPQNHCKQPKSKREPKEAMKPTNLLPLIPRNDLHYEIRKYSYHIKSKATTRLRFVRAIKDELSLVVNSIFPLSSLLLFGSYATGLALESSDVDLQVSNQLYKTRENIQFACRELSRQLSMYPWIENTQCIPTATIPVVKLDAKLTWFAGQGKMSVDISFDDSVSGSDGAHLGANSRNVTRELLVQYPSLEILVILIKKLLYKAGLNNSYTGGLNSYSLLVWVVAFLNRLQTVSKDCGELFIGFLEFYGKRFDRETMVISIRNRGSVVKRENNYGVLTEDPIRITNNLTRTCYNIDRVLKLFESAHDVMLGFRGKGRMNNTLETAFGNIIRDFPL